MACPSIFALLSILVFLVRKIYTPILKIAKTLKALTEKTKRRCGYLTQVVDFYQRFIIYGFPPFGMFQKPSAPPRFPVEEAVRRDMLSARTDERF